MSIKLTKPQADLLSEAHSAGEKGVMKSSGYSPAVSLVAMGYVRWLRKYDNGRSGQLVITAKGRDFMAGQL